MSLIGYSEVSPGVWATPWQRGACEHGQRYDYRMTIYTESARVRPESTDEAQEERTGFDCEECF